jgi:hypothetical protein
MVPQRRLQFVRTHRSGGVDRLFALPGEAALTDDHVVVTRRCRPGSLGRVTVGTAESSGTRVECNAWRATVPVPVRWMMPLPLAPRAAPHPAVIGRCR